MQQPLLDDAVRGREREVDHLVGGQVVLCSIEQARVEDNLGGRSGSENDSGGVGLAMFEQTKFSDAFDVPGGVLAFRFRCIFRRLGLDVE